MDSVGVDGDAGRFVAGVDSSGGGGPGWAAVGGEGGFWAGAGGFGATPSALVSPQWTWEYTRTGKVARVTDPVAAYTTYTYDPYLDWLIEKCVSVGGHAFCYPTTYEYNDAGEVTSIITPPTAAAPNGARTEITYNKAGEPTRVTDPTGRVVRTGYDMAGRVVTTTTGRVSGSSVTSSAPVQATTWDLAGRAVAVSTPAGTRTATYDARNRLVQVTGGGEPDTTFTYNARGQLTAVIENGQTTRSYTYDAFERLVGISGTSLPTVTYAYDSLDRPAQRNSASFGYNDLSNNPVLNPTGIGEATLLRDPTGTTIATRIGTGSGHLVVTDAVHLDTVAVIDPQTGDPVASASYDPWGVPTTSGVLPSGFQGGYTDPDTGLVNAHARWYDPTLATFTSRDTWTLP
ncbi:MAG: hypothetical protein IRY85_06800, partial [Micromonosporaceae bacterium]|nr:hypothetical protein [Micromonosporaceae bacterium]